MPPNSSSSQNTRIFAPYAILTQDTSRLAIKISTGQGYSIVSGITAGDVIRFNPLFASGGLTGQYVKSQADTNTNSEVLGVVESVSGNNYTVVTHGSILYPSARLVGVCAGAGGVDVLFLDAGISGGLTGTVVTSTTGAIVKPVIQLAPHGFFYNGVVVNYIGYKSGSDPSGASPTFTSSGENTRTDLGTLDAGAIQYFSPQAELSSNWLDISSSVLISKTLYPELFAIYQTNNGPYTEVLTVSSSPSILLVNKTAYQLVNGIRANVGTVTAVDSTNKQITITKTANSLMNIPGDIIFANVSGGTITTLRGTATEVSKFSISAIDSVIKPMQGTDELVPYINVSSIKPTLNIPANVYFNTLTVGGTCAIGAITNLENKISSLQSQIDTINNRLV